MSAAALMAALAAALGVAAAWDALAAVQLLRAPAALARALAPLRRAGREGRDPSRAERRRLAAMGSGAGLAAGSLVVGPIVGLALAALAPWGLASAVRFRRARFRRELAAGAPLAARVMADALCAGRSIPGAIEGAAAGVPGAAGRELQAAAAAIALGEPAEQALERLRRRAGASAWDTIVAALLLGRDAGGDLVGLLRRMAGALEDAARVERDARAATAQARFTGLLVCALPLVAAMLSELASPGYLPNLLSSPLPAALALLALVLQVAAFVVIRRVSRVRP